MVYCEYNIIHCFVILHLFCTITTITVKYSGYAERGAVVSPRLFSLGNGEGVPPKTKLERRIFRKLFLVKYFQKTPWFGIGNLKSFH